MKRQSFLTVCRAELHLFSSKLNNALKVRLKVKGGKSLRKGKRVDYKKMNLGKEIKEECTISDDSVEWFDSP